MKRIKRRGRKNFIRQLACFALIVCGATSCTSHPAEKLVQGSVWRDTDGRMITTNYYFDPASVNDANKGTCKSKPFRSLSRMA